MIVTVWMESWDLTCEGPTNVTWYCDQENGKLTCTNSLTRGCVDNGVPAEKTFPDRTVVTDQSVLGLQHAGACNNFVVQCKTLQDCLLFQSFSPFILVFQT
jgi:hypothetical protein